MMQANLIRKPGESLKEANKRVIEHALLENPDMRRLREQFSDRFGFDFIKTDAETLKKFPVREANFSWKKAESKLREADSATSFVQFLRAGVIGYAMDMYQSVPDTWSDWATARSSTKDTELYAPNQGIGFPSEIGRQEPYTEVTEAALDLKLRNRKFGSIFALEYELGEDDQSGTVRQQSAYIGEYLKLVSEVWVYGKLASVSAMVYSNLQIPTTETKPADESVYPWAPPATPLIGGGVNRPASYTVIGDAALKAAIVALINQKNLQGLKMLVNAKRLVVGPNQQYDAQVLLNSTFYPVGAQAAGVVGGAFSANQLKGLLDLTVSRFVFKSDGTVSGDSKAWYVMDDSKPWFAVQMREPISVVAEAPNSGAGFERDVMRFKGRTRMNADFIDPRFAFQGNDGSVTS